jgi:hypothetical protein
MTRQVALGLLLSMSMVLSTARASAAPVIFSSGETTPETISLAPPDFGGYYGRNYVVPDPGVTVNGMNTNTLWLISSAGGSPVSIYQLTTTDADTFRGGLFLPPHFGAVGGDYVVGSGTQVLAFNSSVSMSVLSDTSALGYVALVTPAIVPHSFGTAGGNLFFTAIEGPTAPDYFGGVVEIDHAGNATVFAPTPGIYPFGMAFAPRGFGSVGGDLLVSNSDGNQIVAVNPAGQSWLFTTIPNVNVAGGGGLRQIGFAPPGFGSFGGDLLVSVSATSQGGGSNGHLYVVNRWGQVVAQLDTGAGAFDPRGFTFTDHGQEILISNTSDPILLATAADFVPFSAVPEIGPAALPAVISLLGGGVLVLGDCRRRRSHRVGRG